MDGVMELHESPANVAFSYGRQVYVRAPRPVHFPSEESPEEHVSETKRHLKARTTLFLLLEEALAGAAAVGSEQFVYFDAADPQKCLSPDAFVKLGTREENFETWKVWQRGAPELAVEIVSDSDRSDSDWAAKLGRYQASGIAEVVRFDGEDEEQPLRVWDRIDGDLVERSRNSPALRECVALGLWWAVVPSPFGPMLRLARDRDGRELLQTPSEDRLQLEEALAEERKARSLAEHERTLAEQKLLEAERENERLRAELARLRG
jgi:hypothetical protein